MVTVTEFREWEPEQLFDRQFLHSVPSSARREFLRAFRPLSADCSARVIASLFAGIRQPFHYVRATGWMARLLQSGVALPDTASFGQREACLAARLAWSQSDVILLVYHQPSVYAARWGSFLRYFQAGYLDLDTVLVCHPKARDVVLFWEDHGPIFGKRGHRELPCPTWRDAEPFGEEGIV
jgi:hypothetical protein